MMTEAILLSAGLSSRMGQKNKLLLRYQGKPLIQHAIEALSIKEIDRIIVVTGHDHSAIVALFQDLHIVYNPSFEEGMVTSIQAGVREVGTSTDRFLIMLGDMPHLSATYVETFLRYADDCSDISTPYIFRPIWQEQKGHPVLFSSHFIGPILDSDNKHSLQSVIKSSKDHFFAYKTPIQAFYKDIDTFIDYQKLIHV